MKLFEQTGTEAIRELLRIRWVGKASTEQCGLGAAELAVEAGGNLLNWGLPGCNGQALDP